MARIPRIFDLIKQGKRINEVDEVIPKPKYPFGNLIIKNDDEIRASTAAYRNKLETDNDITRSMSGLEDTKITKKVDSFNERLGIKFNYIEKDGTYYLPMLNTKTAEGLHTQVYLDALKQRDIPIMDGPKGLMSKQ